MADHAHDRLPAWTWIAPLLAAALLALKYAHLIPADATPTLIAAAPLLFCAVFAAVHHAEILALRLGEPFGSILLAVAVTVIEVALIVSIMLGQAPGAETVARDTVFSAVMIVLNGIVGLCLVVGASRHREQAFQQQGTSSALSVLATLAVTTMMMPNFTGGVEGPYYSSVQLIYVGTLSLVLYALFVFVQTVRHRDYFLDLAAEPAGTHAPPPGRIVAAGTALLLVSLVSVVLLAKVLSVPLDRGVLALGLPRAVVGVVIAAIVLLPEGLASVRAAYRNQLQNSLNLALGSAIASIGLTIPVVAVTSLLTGQKLALGLPSDDEVLLLLTLLLGAITLGTGRTAVLQGAVHLVVFAVFLLITAAH
jgi:Ca2+:H+ antiporter